MQAVSAGNGSARRHYVFFRFQFTTIFHSVKNSCSFAQSREFSPECGEFARIVGTMKGDEAANPADVGAFGSAAVVVDGQDFDHAVIQPGSRLF